jgi:hypothetical protein
MDGVQCVDDMCVLRCLVCVFGYVSACVVCLCVCRRTCTWAVGQQGGRNAGRLGQAKLSGGVGDHQA